MALLHMAANCSSPAYGAMLTRRPALLCSSPSPVHPTSPPLYLSCLRHGCLPASQACDVYGTAAALQPDSYSALYNWGVALSDIARIVRPQQPEEAYECLTAAAEKYARALDTNPANPQVRGGCWLWG